MCLSGLIIIEGFGQNETTLSIANFVGSTPKIGSMGRLSPLYDVVVLDPDGNECKTGDTGEICIRVKDDIPCGLFVGNYLDEEKISGCRIGPCSVYENISKLVDISTSFCYNIFVEVSTSIFRGMNQWMSVLKLLQFS